MYKVKKSITINGRPLSVEIADTPLKRSIGLMYRKELPADAGMLFVFPESANRSFWMKDTHIPLSIAYINEDGVITNIENMDPFSLDSISSKDACKYALETNRGWFNSHDIKPGCKVVIKNG